MFGLLKEKWQSRGKPKRKSRDVDYRGKTYKLRRNGKWTSDDGTVIPIAVMAGLMVHNAVAVDDAGSSHVDGCSGGSSNSCCGSDGGSGASHSCGGSGCGGGQ